MRPITAAGLTCLLLRPPTCVCSEPPAPVAAAEERRPSAPERAAERADPPRPLASDEPVIDLPVQGFAAALVSLPLGATARRPVAVVAHGNNDGPEQQCPTYRDLLGDRAFVLCPRGIPREGEGGRFTYAGDDALDDEIDAALAALRARFPDHVDDGPSLYVGFSLGSHLGVALTSQRPSHFPRVILVEGGHDRWTSATANAFTAGGGLRVLFACGQLACAEAARPKAALLEAAGAAARVILAENAGHRSDGPVAALTRDALPWLLEGDPRWGLEGPR
jgi:hypothetical protein